MIDKYSWLLIIIIIIDHDYDYEFIATVLIWSDKILLPAFFNRFGQVERQDHWQGRSAVRILGVPLLKWENSMENIDRHHDINYMRRWRDVQFSDNFRSLSKIICGCSVRMAQTRPLLHETQCRVRTSLKNWPAIYFNLFQLLMSPCWIYFGIWVILRYQSWQLFHQITLPIFTVQPFATRWWVKTMGHMVRFLQIVDFFMVSIRISG